MRHRTYGMEGTGRNGGRRHHRRRRNRHAVRTSAIPVGGWMSPRSVREKTSDVQRTSAIYATHSLDRTNADDSNHRPLQLVRFVPLAGVGWRI
jgi:hypothetical protein